MFSLHLMIADMLSYIPPKSDTSVNVDNYFMRGCPRKKKITEILICYTHLNLLLELQNIISNEAKNIILRNSSK